MPTPNVHQPRNTSSYQAEYPRLASLGLTDDEFSTLKRQGFISRETRAVAQHVFKLRFRVGGLQRVKYLGTDPHAVDAVFLELQQLQLSRRKDLTLKSLNREAAELLKDCKQWLEPHLNAAGLRFHGRTIRRPHRRVTTERS